MKQDNKEKSFNSHDRTVYVDMDGVIADFHGYFKTIFGWDIPKGDPINKSMEKKMWDNINEYGKAKFFEDLPWILGGKDMWNFIVDHFVNVKILSALGKNNGEVDSTRKGKMAWLAKHIPKLREDDIFLVENKYKKQEYSRPGDIIIDDTLSVIEEWNVKGGTGIFFTNAQSVIQKLEKLVYEENDV